MYSKIKVAGHPMLVAFPVACYTGTLVGFAVRHHQPPIPLRRRHAA